MHNLSRKFMFYNFSIQVLYLHFSSRDESMGPCLTAYMVSISYEDSIHFVCWKWHYNVANSFS